MKRFLIASGVAVVVFYAVGLTVQELINSGPTAMTSAVISGSAAFYFIWSRVMAEKPELKKGP